MDEESSHGVIRRALEMGVNFFDAAMVYSGGASEQFLGRAILLFI
ncbi:MAG: aldo/keto reductase [Clostridiales bacterium]|nr:aldo/keto reductase [Clostridiales bacterium]